MKMNKWLLGAAVAGGSLLVGIVVGVLLMKIWTHPMAPSLPTLVPTATMRAEKSPSATAAAGEAVSPTPPPSPTAPPSPTPTPEPMCGGPASMTILAVGTNHGFYDLADVIRVVRVDFVKGEVYVVPLPRDLLVDLPKEATTYPSPQKINEGYFLGTPVWQMGADQSGGAALLAQTLAHNFGITTDHYVVVSSKGLDDFIDALGGLQVYLPVPVVDDKQAHANFPAGNQVLDGYHVVLLARIRKDVGDFGRIQRQTLILKALLRRLTAPSVLPKLPELFKLYRSLVMTDLSLEQATQLACLLQKMDNPEKHIHFYSVPRGLLDEEGRIIYIGPNKSTVPQDVLLWDDRYKQWLHDALEGKVQP